ncbi:uncharacterized protein LOC134268410 [Saccostrea cucullata]|uniref:uncharacterized protein LOC134268410 n=1 Tax=Saccostrea cuccullata TaxID=36930 RepID=UPI002ED48EDB
MHSCTYFLKHRTEQSHLIFLLLQTLRNTENSDWKYLTMEKRFYRFLIAIMLMASMSFNCQALLESPVKKKNVLNIRLKEQCQDLVKDSVTEDILKIRKELKKNLEDLRLDVMRRDVELYEEIYNVHENLTGNDTTKEKQTTSLDDGERTVWLKKFEYLEAGIKKASQESMNNADTLQENLERLDRENRKISSRMETLEITLMKVASQSSFNLNDSEGLIFTNYLRKLHRVDDRLNDINDTMQDVGNSTTDMQKAMGTFQSEVMSLKSSVNALSRHINSTLDDTTRAIEDLSNLSENVQLNRTKVLNENEQYFSKELLKLMRIVSEVSNLSNSNLNSLQDLSSQEKQFEVQVNHSKQDLKNEMTVRKNQFNITVTFLEDLKDKQLEISDDLMNINLRISISDAWNVTKEELGILNNSFYEKLTEFNTQVQLVFKENSIQSEQLNSITASVNDLRRKIHVHYNVYVRLVGGTSASEGRVEVYHYKWGTICDDNWDNSDARVVCRMLGYSGSYTAYGSAHYGEGTGQIWLDDVSCSGSESSLIQCIHPEWGVHNCRHHEDASVKCT